jgi:hypothetical protein
MKVAEQSFVRFVYPFLFEPSEFRKLAEAAGKAKWQGRERAFHVWKEARFHEEDLLAHVRDYLNPPAGKAPTALLWEMQGDALQSPLGLGAQADWWLVHPRCRVPFRIREVRLALFRTGVGFLTAEVNPKTEVLDDWQDLLHSFRLVRGQHEVGVKVQRKTASGCFEPYFPPAAGGVEKHPDGEGTFGEVLDAVMNTIGIKPQEVFVPGYLIPFAALYVDNQDISDQQIGELLYRVRNFFHSRQEIHPSAGDLSLDHPAMLVYADKMWFTFSLEGGAFVAVNAPQAEFFRKTLCDYLRDQYFLLFLMALHQRFALMRLSQDVSEHCLSGCKKDRVEAFERIRSALLEFTARGYFTQIMQRERHHRVYRKWREVFMLDELYREVSDEVRELHECLLSEQTRRLEQRVNWLGALIGVPALVMGFLSINLYGITSKGEGLPIWLALSVCFLGGVVLAGLGLWLLQRE